MIGTQARTFRKAVLVLLAAGVLTGCASRELTRYKAQLDKTDCNQWEPPSGSAQQAIAPLTMAEIPPAAQSRFSPNSLHIAHAIGVLPMLDEFLRQVDVPREERTLEQRVQLLELRRRIAYRCDLASLEISSVASELDCEEEKISQLAHHLKEIEQTRETRLNVAAIAVGALGAVVTGIHFSQDNPDPDVDGIGIGFGIAEAGLGVMMLLTGKHTSFMHPRNALRAIHDGQDPDGIFPASVWYCLTNPVPGSEAKETLRQELMDRWRDAEPNQAGDEQDGNDLLLGNGGEYTTDLLEKRASRYDQLESSIKLVKQDLLQLVQELDAQTRP
ncbi:MAG: hypothetical protein JST45_07380 [Bacteroidetes bacterium]|nr:hypothetical protein [Bacteroidota bacterium]